LKFDFSGSNFALEHRISVITPFSIIFYSIKYFYIFLSIVEVATLETMMSKVEKWEDHVAAQP